MKKILSILLMVALVLSVGVTAFADTTGSITITNATIGQTYELYKLFDARYSGDAVSYSIEKSNQFYAALFNDDGTPVSGNTFFAYNVDTKEVTKVKGVSDTDLVAYVKDIIQGGSFTTQVAPVTATQSTVLFDGIPYGYYIVDIDDVGGMITITSNTPDASVIDKNQTPLAGGIEKKLWNADANGGAGAWEDENTAFVGDIVKYRVTFVATNYAGMEQIRHYTMHDVKGDALWVEFGDDTIDTYDIVVKVGDTVLTKGYYHLANQEIKTAVQEWEFLGTWTEQEKADQRANRNVAEWYLIHYGYDVFEIVIPWLNGHTFNGTDTGFDIAYPADATSKYASPSNVEILYYASVEPNANIGVTDNLYNTAYVKWTSLNNNKTSETDTVYTHVDGLGIHKMDAATNKALQGAVFEIYKDEACTQPLYVIPTNIEGVYVYDDLDALGQLISGENKKTARELYAAKLNEYLGTAAQKNVLVTPVNGKIVVAGLKSGTYYVKEVTPPSGYNSLAGAIEITAGNTDNRFYIYASENGTVDNIQSPTPVFAEKEYIVEVAEVFNSKGVELPSTGGTGTIWLITIGTLLAIGFGVFLITHKKMSVYAD